MYIEMIVKAAVCAFVYAVIGGITRYLAERQKGTAVQAQSIDEKTLFAVQCDMLALHDCILALQLDIVGLKEVIQQQHVMVCGSTNDRVSATVVN